MRNSVASIIRMARDNEAGAALVEAALVLPVLLLLVLSVAEISLYLWNANLAAKAVQLGLRYTIVSDAVAFGPGLDRDSSDYWNDLTPGQRCVASDRDPCPRFSVTCSLAGSCSCQGTCRFTPAPARGTPILHAMRAMLPDLTSANVEISYTTNGLGYVGRPTPVPVNVTVRLVRYSSPTLFLGDLFGGRLPLIATASAPSEDLLTR